MSNKSKYETSRGRSVPECDNECQSVTYELVVDTHCLNVSGTGKNKTKFIYK